MDSLRDVLFRVGMLDINDQHEHLAARHFNASTPDEGSAGCAFQIQARDAEIDTTETWTRHVLQMGPEELAGVFKRGVFTL